MTRSRLAGVALGCLTAWIALTPPGTRGQDFDGPLIDVETARGTFSIQTFPDDAPRTVAHVVALVSRGFYDGLRVHRAVPASIVQFGDPQTRDAALRELWGRGPRASSGHAIGVAEINPGRTHRRGAVAVAHPGDPTLADSQIFIALADLPQLDGQYAIFGQVVGGAEVPPTLQVGDLIQRMSVRR